MRDSAGPRRRAARLRASLHSRRARSVPCSFDQTLVSSSYIQCGSARRPRQSRIPRWPAADPAERRRGALGRLLPTGGRTKSPPEDSAPTRTPRRRGCELVRVNGSRDNDACDDRPRELAHDRAFPGQADFNGCLRRGLQPGTRELQRPSFVPSGLAEAPSSGSRCPARGNIPSNRRHRGGRSAQ